MSSTKQVPLRLSTKLIGQIEEIAAADGVSPGAWMEGALLGAVLQRRLSSVTDPDPVALADVAHALAHEEAVAGAGPHQAAIVDEHGNRIGVIDVGHPIEELDP